MELRLVSISSHRKPPTRIPAGHGSPGEQRGAVRYSLVLRAAYFWRHRGVPREAEGVTRDVSARGAYIDSMDCPPRGAKVEIKLTLPGGRRGRSPVLADAEGSVLRVDEPLAGRTGGFAVKSDGLRFFSR